MEDTKLKEFAEFLLKVDKDGGRYQIFSDVSQRWLDCGYDSKRGLSWHNFEINYLRLKPNKTGRKKIPLEFEDITPSTVFRREGCKEISSMLYADPSFVLFLNTSTLPVLNIKESMFLYISLVDAFEYSTDNGKTWKGCYKYED